MWLLFLLGGGGQTWPDRKDSGGGRQWAVLLLGTLPACLPGMALCQPSLPFFLPLTTTIMP